MPKLSLAKLERHLYAAADILRREGMDAATYKDYIFGLRLAVLLAVTFFVLGFFVGRDERSGSPANRQRTF